MVNRDYQLRVQFSEPGLVRLLLFLRGRLDLGHLKRQFLYGVKTVNVQESI